MSARFNIQMLGDKELERNLAQLTDKVERNILVKSMRSAGKTVLDDAIRRAPLRATQIAPGTSKRRARQLHRLALHFARLRNTLHLKPLRRRKNRVGYAVWTGTREELGITGPSYYPAHVEWGHAAPHRTRRLRASGVSARRVRQLLRTEFGGRRTPPHPFLRPALKQNESRILAQLASDIRARIEQEVRP